MSQINHLNLVQKLDCNKRGLTIERTTNNQIKFKASMLKSSLCDYSDAYTVAEGTI